MVSPEELLGLPSFSERRRPSWQNAEGNRRNAGILETYLPFIRARNKEI